ncbi:transposase [Nocardiopsis rhodophaea]|uniref:transposase n=1 Tax=Nocardiopsis rhodophaea TaxID=280238 RepID=UPI00338BAC62
MHPRHQGHRRGQPVPDGFDQNRIWLELVLLALDLLAWAQMLALAGRPARQWEPKRLRLRLFSAAVWLVATGRRRLLRFDRTWPSVGQQPRPRARLLADAIERLRLPEAPT